MKFIVLFICIFLPSLIIAEEIPTYSFGVLSQRSALITGQYWNPILAYVSAKSGVKLYLQVERTAPQSNEAIKKGRYDFVYSNTIFEPKMASAHYHVILRPLDEVIRGQIVTLEDSPIKTLHDLEGKEVGFPSITAFVGYAVPMQYLLQQKTHVTPVFGGNQEGIMAQLKVGKVIAAGVNSQVMQSFAMRENIDYRVLWESEQFFNIPIAVHPRVKKESIMKIQKVFDEMDNTPEGLKVLEESAQIIGQKPPYGFRISSPEEYQNHSDFYRKNAIQEVH